MRSEDSGAAAPSYHHSELPLLRAPATTQSSSCSELPLLRAPATTQNSSCSDVLPHTAATTQNSSCSELPLLRTTAAHNSSCPELQPPPLRAQKSCHTQLPPLRAPAAPLPQSAPQSFTSVTYLPNMLITLPVVLTAVK